MSATGMNENPYPTSRRNGFEIDDLDRQIIRLLGLHTNSQTVQVSQVPRPPRATNRICVSCRERFPITEIFIANCDHGYCRACLAELAERSFKNKYPFPPRCCGKHFTLDLIHPFITKEMERAYARKQIEHEAYDRTYCSNIACQTFIPPRSIKSGVVCCPVCPERTCVKCKNRAHRGRCVEDEALNEVLYLAERKGWRRCPRCKSIIERVWGCNHMMCRCDYEFCFRCGKRWKTHGRQCCPEGIYIEDIIAMARNIGRAAREFTAEVAADILVKGPTCLDRLWIPLRKVINKFRVRDHGLIRDHV